MTLNEIGYNDTVMIGVCNLNQVLFNLLSEHARQCMCLADHWKDVEWYSEDACDWVENVICPRQWNKEAYRLPPHKYLKLRNYPYVHNTTKRPTRLIASAVLKGDRIWTGTRHGEIIPHVYEDTGEKTLRDEQGFYTDTGLFVCRGAGEAIVRCNGQKCKCSDRNDTFLSEHLW